MNTLALILTLLAGSYLICLAAVSVVSPDRARAFLSSLAGSAFAHGVEVFVRIIIGAALVVYAPMMRFSTVFFVIGWVLIVTSMILAALPWRWHRWFASRTVPNATRFMPLLALGALAGGVFLIAAVILGPQR